MRDWEEVIKKSKPLFSNRKSMDLRPSRIKLVIHHEEVPYEHPHPPSPLAAYALEVATSIPLDFVKRGEGFVPECLIDLHGHTLEGAYEALWRFTYRARENGKRRCLVITGKGRGGENSIQEAFKGWVQTPRIASHVLAFARAAPKHGGSGAYYVVLRK